MRALPGIRFPGPSALTRRRNRALTPNSHPLHCTVLADRILHVDVNIGLRDQEASDIDMPFTTGLIKRSVTTLISYITTR